MAEMIKQPGGYVYVVDALHWDGSGEIIKLGVSWPQLRRHVERGMKFKLGQFYGIVEPGIITAKRVFRGLKRGMLVNGDKDADTRKLAYCWVPVADYRLVGNKFAPELEKFTAPENRVFVTMVSPNDQSDNYPDITGWIEHWSWVDICPEDGLAPIDNGTRYAERLI